MGFFQIGIAEEDKKKTAFCVQNGLFQFKVLPMGMTNSPGTFQRVMDSVLYGLNWKQCLCYLDDIIVFSKTFEDYLVNLELVFKALLKANLKLKPSKCEFLKQTIRFLGHVITPDGIQPDPFKIELIKNLKAPRNITELKSFMGIISYYSKFIANLSRIAHPLLELTRKYAKFIWTENNDKIFELLKEKLISPPLLILPDFSKEFLLQCDASDQAIGVVLSQQTELGDQPIAYASRRLNKAEQKYSVTEKELLAIVWATKYFRHSLYGRKIIIFTDHKPIAALKHVKEPHGRIGRLLIKIQDLDYSIVYKQGKLNGNSDFVSLLKHMGIKLSYDIDCKSEQLKDNQLNELIKSKLDPNYAPVNLEKGYVASIGRLSLNTQGMLVHNDEKFGERIVVPKHLVGQFLIELHECPLSGHLGVKKTISRVNTRYY